jgi:RNA-directed DNA polymerase
MTVCNDERGRKCILLNNKRTANSDGRNAARQWKQIDWERAETFIKKIQARIAKAAAKSNKKLVRELQRMLRHSYYAKALAVRRVTKNKGKNTPGIDGAIWEKPERKYKAIQEIDMGRYAPKPLRRVHIRKTNGKKRPLGIPTMRDRAIQGVEAMALDPVVETQSDRVSFGFRKGRSCADAMQQCFLTLSKKNKARWILEGDIKACFDEISHQWLLENAAMERNNLAKILKSGYIEKGKLHPTTSGTPQGGLISPILANQTLNGLEPLLRKTFHHQKATKNSGYYSPKVNLIRYADDFIVTAADRETAEKVKETVKKFIEARGLRLSEEKTLITEIQDGFNLLGWNFRKYKGKLLIKPSKKSMQKVIDNMREIIHKHQSASQDVLISKLNPVITGWSNYHQGVVAKKAFERIDHTLFQMLWMWAVKRHPNKGKGWVKNKYWKVEGTRHWVFRGERKCLRKMSDLKIVRHVSLKLDKNPYTDRRYFAKRKLLLEANKLTGRAKKVWNRQKGLCPLCKTVMDKMEERKMYYLERLQPEKGKPMKETLFIHKACVRNLSQATAGTATIRPCFL